MKEAVMEPILITSIRRVQATAAKYEIVLVFDETERAYVAEIHEYKEARGLIGLDVVQRDIPLTRCPFLGRQIVRAVLRIHDGQTVVFPVVADCSG